MVRIVSDRQPRGGCGRKSSPEERALVDSLTTDEEQTEVLGETDEELKSQHTVRGWGGIQIA